MKWWLLVAALLLLGCLGRPSFPRSDLLVTEYGTKVKWQQYPLRVLVPAESPLAFQAAVRRSTALWNRKVGLTVFEVHRGPKDLPAFFGEDSGVYVTIQLASFASVTTYDGYVHQVQGETWFREAREFSPTVTAAHIEISHTLREEKLDQVLVHELGHVLGLGHDRDINSVMYRYTTKTSHAILKSDVDYVRKQVRPE